MAMSAPLVPSPLDYIGRRRFALYPAIRNCGPNEWLLGTGSWSEVQAVNAKTGREIWIPRQHIGAVSDNGNALLVVGLRKQLDLRGDCLEPRVKRVIEIPQALSDSAPCENPTFKRRGGGPAPVIGIRLETEKKSPMNKAVVDIAIGALLIGLLAALLGSSIRF